MNGWMDGLMDKWIDRLDKWINNKLTHIVPYWNALQEPGLKKGNDN